MASLFPTQLPQICASFCQTDENALHLSKYGNFSDKAIEIIRHAFFNVDEKISHFVFDSFVFKKTAVSHCHTFALGRNFAYDELEKTFNLTQIETFFKYVECKVQNITKNAFETFETPLFSTEEMEAFSALGRQILFDIIASIALPILGMIVSTCVVSCGCFGVKTYKQRKFTSNLFNAALIIGGASLGMMYLNELKNNPWVKLYFVLTAVQ